MSIHSRRVALRPIFVVLGAAAVAAGRPAFATGVPIDGFLPMAGFSLTRDFINDILPLAPVASSTMGAPQLGAGGVPHYDVALLDTGAAVSIINSASRAAFGADTPYSGLGGSDGFTGAYQITIGGATGFVQGDVLDMMGLFAGGLQPPTRLSNSGPLQLDPTTLLGQTNTAVAAVPPTSDLPNVLGLSYISQYATRIRADQAQVFAHNGQTVRTPSIEFLPRGSGGLGITRKAPLSLLGQSPVTPQHVPNVDNIEQWFDKPYEDPSSPTLVLGGLFLTVDVEDDKAGAGGSLDNYKFFFDTGASVTVLSEFNASRLGFHVGQSTPEFTISVVGSGGVALDVPGFFVDKFTIPAIGGNIVATNVPVVVLDIVDPADPNNVIAGFVGTNLLAGRNLVIDPNPAVSGGPTAGLYISDPVTTNSNWTSPSPSTSWSSAANWSSGATPTMYTIANLRHVAGSTQEAVVASDASAWEINVSGSAAGQKMTLSVTSGAKLTTFAGLNIEQNGVVYVTSGSTIDVQYVDIRGGKLGGGGAIATGSGPIPGQVENVSGIVAPGLDAGLGYGIGTLSIEGRYSNGKQGVLEMEIRGATASQYDRLAVDGAATLAGTLRVLLPGSGAYVPVLGDKFTILAATGEMAGQFDILNLPALATGRMWFVGYESHAVVLKVTLPGDFDGNGTVAPADLVVWKADNGKRYTGADFLAWQRFLGQSIPLAASVPEPASAGLALLAALALARVRRRSP